ncbi:twin-arginine translocation signal domain-containing protein [Candidatus Pacearchaeota archaeon]|nr:twin-arginine translocation signal domain-containing protein [Candidatus Pacearchaeota archaeon]
MKIARREFLKGVSALAVVAAVPVAAVKLSEPDLLGYEEGAFTSADGLQGSYTKIGNTVYVNINGRYVFGDSPLKVEFGEMQDPDDWSLNEQT